MLKCFSLESPELGVTEISEKLGLAKSVAHNDLAVLVRGNFLGKNEKSATYYLGPEIIRLGQVSLQHSSLRRIALPIMECASATLEETTYLGGWLNAKAYCIEVVNGPHPLKVTLNLGEELSLHGGAAGKTLVAFLPDEDREKILKTYVPIRHTSKTITDLSKLRKELAGIRKKGYGTSVEESYRDIAAAGVPIFAADGKVVACICCAGPVSRFKKERVGSVVAVLKKAANDISLGLGFVANRN